MLPGKWIFRFYTRCFHQPSSFQLRTSPTLLASSCGLEESTNMIKSNNSSIYWWGTKTKTPLRRSNPSDGVLSPAWTSRNLKAVGSIENVFWCIHVGTWSYMYRLVYAKTSIYFLKQTWKEKLPRIFFVNQFGPCKDSPWKCIGCLLSKQAATSSIL